MTQINEFVNVVDKANVSTGKYYQPKQEQPGDPHKATPPTAKEAEESRKAATRHNPKDPQWPRAQSKQTTQQHTGVQPVQEPTDHRPDMLPGASTSTHLPAE